jgi:hypothetical protein
VSLEVNCILLFYAVMQSVFGIYYLALPTATGDIADIQYIFRFAALTSIMVAFAHYTMMWVELLEFTVKGHRRAEIVQKLLQLMVVVGALVVSGLVANYGTKSVTREGEPYADIFRVYLCFLSGASLALCLFFLYWSFALWRKVRMVYQIEHTLNRASVANQLFAVISACACCLTLRTFMTATLAYNLNREGIKALTPILIWLTLSQWIPETGLFCIMVHHTRVRPENANQQHSYDDESLRLATEFEPGTRYGGSVTRLLPQESDD